MVRDMSGENFRYEVKKHIATLSQTEDGRFTKEVNLISYNGAEPKLDIRKWDRENDKMQKGVTLNEAEVSALKACLAQM